MNEAPNRLHLVVIGAVRRQSREQDRVRGRERRGLRRGAVGGRQPVIDDAR